MFDFIVDKILCLNCHARITKPEENINGDSLLICSQCKKIYPIVDGIFECKQDDVVRSCKKKIWDTSDALQSRYWEEDAGYLPCTSEVSRFFSEQRWEYIAKKLSLENIETAIDVGCGNGVSSSGLKKQSIKVVSCDGSRKMLRDHPGDCRFLVDAYRLPFEDETFDLSYSWELIHHIAKPSVAILEMARVSRKWVVILDPNPLNPAQAMFALADRGHRLVLRNSYKFLASAIKEAGLNIHHHAIVGCVFPNKTPYWLMKILRHIPFTIPQIGISHLFIAEKR